MRLLILIMLLGTSAGFADDHAANVKKMQSYYGQMAGAPTWGYVGGVRSVTPDEYNDWHNNQYRSYNRSSYSGYSCPKYYTSSYGGHVGTGSNPNSEYVHGYVRQDGTVVGGYYRTQANDTVLDNYSTYGNYNPYTGRYGTKRY